MELPFIAVEIDGGRSCAGIGTAWRDMGKLRSGLAGDGRRLGRAVRSRPGAEGWA